MLDILIVEDDKTKLDSICAAISEINEKIGAGINVAESVIEAKSLLEKMHFDIVVIDLVIPLRKGEPAIPDNCQLLLDEIGVSPFLKTPTTIIGLTQFSELNERYEAIFTKRMFHLLNFDYSSLEWVSKLKGYIYHFAKQKKSFIDPDELLYKYDAVFICALYEPEFVNVLKLNPGKWKKFSHANDPTLYFETILTRNGQAKKVLAVYSDQMGMVASTALATKVMIKFHPKYLIMTGITAGIKLRGLTYGDIIIPDLCWDYGNGKIKEFVTKDEQNETSFQKLHFEPEPKSIPLSAIIKNRVIDYANNKEALAKIRDTWTGIEITTNLQAKIGPLASGSQVVASSTKIKEINLQNRKLLGIEMEAYGLFYATSQVFNSQIIPIVIKSVCDFGDEDKGDMFQDYAAYTSAQFAYNLLFEVLE